MNPILPAILTMNHTQSWHLGFLDKKFRKYWITSKITPLQLLVIKHKLSTQQYPKYKYIYMYYIYFYTHISQDALELERLATEYWA